MIICKITEGSSAKPKYINVLKLHEGLIYKNYDIQLYYNVYYNNNICLLRRGPGVNDLAVGWR